MRCDGTERQHWWTKVLLERSQGHPVTFHLYISAPFHRDEVKSILRRHAGCIHKLIIDSDIDLPPMVVWTEFQMFMLENLELFDYRQRAGMCVTVVRDMSYSLSAKSCPFQLPLTDGVESTQLNWSTWQTRGITSLTLDYLVFGSGIRISNRDLCAILSRNSDTLEHLEIIDTAPIVSTMEYPFLVTLPRLKSLSIGYARAASLIPLVEALYLPALRFLSIRDVARAPNSSTPKYIWGIDYDFGCLDGGIELLTALHRFDTVTHLEASGVRCHEPSILMDVLTLESLTLFDSDDLFASLICPLPAPPNGWRNNSPCLTRSGFSLAELTVTSRCHEMFTDYLTKRSESQCPPLRSLTLSPCCIHSAYAESIKEKKWDEIAEDADKRIKLAMKSANALKVIAQPLVGALRNPEVADLTTSECAIDREALWRFVPDIILSIGDDSDDEWEENAPWPWLAELDSWEMEL
jgi:hypothetical protein